MGDWNNELGGILLMKNNRGGWNKQGRWTFSSKKDTAEWNVFLRVTQSINSSRSKQCWTKKGNQQVTSQLNIY